MDLSLTPLLFSPFSQMRIHTATISSESFTGNNLIAKSGVPHDQL